LHAGNAEKFLASGNYEQQQTGGKLPVVVEHTIGGRAMKFRVYDDTSNFRKFEWKAVVGVVADGKKWQFSGWPFKSEADLFSSIKGFFLKYVDEPLDNVVAGWNVQILNLKREGRHQDASVAEEFWKGLESFLLKHNSRKFSNEHKL
jgi:parafibromin